MSALRWTDLLAVPFAEGGDDPEDGLDCWGQLREVCRRRGVRVPESTADFVRVDDPEVGDVLASDPERKGYPSHVSVVVAPGHALSTSKNHGPYAWPIHRIPQEYGAWRVRPLE